MFRKVCQRGSFPLGLPPESGRNTRCGMPELMIISEPAGVGGHTLGCTVPINKSTIKQINNPTPYFDFGGAGETLHFAHANAYPPGSYQQLIKPLTKKYRVIGIEQRPLWPKANPQYLTSWEQLADDLILFFDQQKLTQIVGVGHSLGAVVSVIAAKKRPDLFRRLILLEPVLFPQYFQWIFAVVPIWLRQRIIPVSRIANNRKYQWPDRETLFNSYRKKRIFRKLSDGILNDWIDYGTHKNAEGQLQLTFPKSWESRVYATVPYVIKDILNLSVPVHILRGEKTDVISPAIWQRIQQHLPKDHLWELENSTHLVPLEFPVEVGEWILEATERK